MTGPGRQCAGQIKQAANGAAVEGVAASSQIAAVWQANNGPVGNNLDDFDAEQFLEWNIGKHPDNRVHQCFSHALFLDSRRRIVRKAGSLSLLAMSGSAGNINAQYESGKPQVSVCMNGQATLFLYTSNSSPPSAKSRSRHACSR